MIWDAIMADFDGRYRRERLLGAGGMGEVWLAFDEELGDRPVAIKMMRSRMLTETDDAARFQREMRLASRMQHPNILTVYTTGTDNGVPYMVGHPGNLGGHETWEDAGSWRHRRSIPMSCVNAR